MLKEGKYPLSLLIILLGLVLGGVTACSGPATGISETREIALQTSDSTELYVKISGSGTPCLFIHGGPGAWSKSFEWMKGNHLEESFRMIYYDQRGCGRSSQSDDYSLERMLMDIEEIRKHLGLDQMMVMGHSFGGILASEYCLQFEENVLGLVLLNATLSITESLKSQIALCNKLTGTQSGVELNDSVVLMEFAKARQRLEAAGLSYRILSDRKESCELLDSIDQDASRQFDFAKKVWSYPVYMEDFSEKSSQVSVPVLIVTGTRDHAVGVEHYKSFNFSNSSVKELEGGHLIYYENHPELLKILVEFEKVLL